MQELEMDTMLNRFHISLHKIQYTDVFDYHTTPLPIMYL